MCWKTGTLRHYLPNLIIIGVLFFVLGHRGLANNLQLSDPAVVVNPLVDMATISFDIQWENSWRDPLNYDAAWVFVKWSSTGSGVWSHASLSQNTSDHTAPAGVEIIVGNAPFGTSATGVFIQRSTSGDGSFGPHTVQLLWNSGDDVGPIPTVDVQVFAIEMVYIPEGSFIVGDNVSSNSFSSTIINNPDPTVGHTIILGEGTILGGRPFGQEVPGSIHRLS